MNKQISHSKIMGQLKNVSKKNGRSINELRLILALERSIARIDANHLLSKHIIFKGGFVLFKTINTNRFTRDIDALAIGISRKKIPELITKALSANLEDGFWFGDVLTEDLKDQGPYGGYRFSIAYQIGDSPDVGNPKIKRFSRLHIDIGFGDPIENLTKKQVMPSILGFSQPVSWSIYPFEYIFSEKLEALFSRGSSNSRAKDIYDMPLVYQNGLDIKKLITAINRTFKNRETPIPESFFMEANKFNLEMMKTAWKSIEIMEANKKFEESWALLLGILKKIDSQNR